MSDAPTGDAPPDLVTVVLCTRDRGRSIVATIASILDSDHANFELLIVDQSSSSATADAIATEFDDARIDYRRADDVGVSRSRNRGLRAASSEFVLMTDDDCIVKPDWIRANVDALRAPEAPGVVYCDVFAVDDGTGGYTPESVASGDAWVRRIGE